MILDFEFFNSLHFYFRKNAPNPRWTAQMTIFSCLNLSLVQRFSKDMKLRDHLRWELRSTHVTRKQ